MTRRLGVVVMSALLLLYIVLVGARAFALLQAGFRTGEVAAVVMGGAMIVLPLIGGWALGRELWFGWRSERLARRLEAEGGVPTDAVGLSTSGRITREDGDALFPKYRAEVEHDESDWRAWFRLALAYDAAGDRPRARAATREAIRRERTESHA